MHASMKFIPPKERETCAAQKDIRGGHINTIRGQLHNMVQQGTGNHNSTTNEPAIGRQLRESLGTRFLINDPACYFVRRLCQAQISVYSFNLYLFLSPLWFVEFQDNFN